MYKKLYLKNKPIIFIIILFCIHADASACNFCLENAAQGFNGPNYTYQPQPQHYAHPQQQSPCPVFGGGFTYVKLGGILPSVHSDDEAYPALSLGQRYEWGQTAVDISLNFGGNEWDYHCSFPKILFLGFIDAYAECSPYIGGGLSWGETRYCYRKFSGIYGELAFGYEFQRTSPIRTFVELDISKGFLCSHRSRNLPPPSVTLAAGIGY